MLRILCVALLWAMALPLAVAQRWEAPALRPLKTERPRKFEPLSRYQRPPGNWEVSVRMLPWSSPVWSRSQRFSTTEPTDESGFDRRTFTLSDGSSIPLYSDSYSFTYDYYNSADRRFGMLVGNIEVARRFSNGLRLSLGISRINYEFGGSADPERYRANMREADYMLVRITDGGQQTLGSVGLQYTINRRRRFRVNLGLMLMYSIRDRNSYEDWLLGPEDGEHHFVSRFEGRYQYNQFLPIPQITFEYRLTPTWALSAGVGGSTGIGVTWQPPTKVKWGDQPEGRRRRSGRRERVYYGMTTY